MSAFVCSNKTINTIVACLEYAGSVPEQSYDTLIPPLQKEFPKDLLTSPKELGETLYKMNINAVEQRYPDCVGNENNLPGRVDENGNHVKYIYNEESITCAEQILKALDCYIYQCSEGDVPSLPLYNAIAGYINILEAFISRNSKDYENAEWDMI